MMTTFQALPRCCRPAIGVLLAALIPCLATGCGGSKQGLEGKVTLDDRPLANGYITFRPLAAAKGPTVGGPIEDGRYAIQSKIPLEGQFRVEITAMGKTGQKCSDDAGHQFDVEAQILPACYNTKSELDVTIEPKKNHDFPFSLKSK
jgi:hypothetical protein